MQLGKVFDLVRRVRRRGRILRLVLASGRRLVVGRRLVALGLLLVVAFFRLVVSNRRSARRPDKQRPPPCPSPETHGNSFPQRGMTP